MERISGGVPKINKPKQTSTTSVQTSGSDNERITWEFLTSSGFTPEQTAGIMGNLQQEHNFRTDGDGLAQWIGNRKAKLYARSNPTSIHTQLDFLLHELNTSERRAYDAIKQSSSLGHATKLFQDMFERCNPYYCMEEQRIGYAKAIYDKYK